VIRLLNLAFWYKVHTPEGRNTPSVEINERLWGKDFSQEVHMTHDQLKEKLIFLTLHGSHAYGTSTPQSDYDIRGVAIAPFTTYFGTRNWEQLTGSSPSLDQLLYKKKPEAARRDDTDCVIFNITKFARLAADANPNILDILFAHPDDWLHASPYWREFHAHRHLFLSKKIRHTYTGYAISQLKRVKSHRKWLLEPPKEKPTRGMFGLPPDHSLVPRKIRDLAESFLKTKQAEWKLDGFLESMCEEDRERVRTQLREYFELCHGRVYHPDEPIERSMGAMQSGIQKDLFARLEQERAYQSANRHWKQYQHWKKSRNPERAALEAKFGYDTKHASHLVRLMLSAIEIATRCDLSVRSPHAELITRVRQGEWSYDELIAWAEVKEKEVKEKVDQSDLPHAPDRDKIDQLVTSLCFAFPKKQEEISLLEKVEPPNSDSELLN
jgi:predicted nucleotidyltransferase